MSTQHTPGPWVEWLDEDTNSFSIYTDPHKRGYGEWIAEVHGTRGSFKANARLIAAAPDLLAACKSAHETLLTFARLGVLTLPHEQQALDLLRAAIAKAHGTGPG